VNNSLSDSIASGATQLSSSSSSMPQGTIIHSGISPVVIASPSPETNDYEEFCNRHSRCTAKRESLVDYLEICAEEKKKSLLLSSSCCNDDLPSFESPLFIGIDVGSTTTKMVVLGSESQLLFTDYGNNKGFV
jgi:activator of 2-hydroxyglutaryl-CoA dehydratase